MRPTPQSLPETRNSHVPALPFADLAGKSWPALANFEGRDSGQDSEAERGCVHPKCTSSMQPLAGAPANQPNGNGTPAQEAAAFAEGWRLPQEVLRPPASRTVSEIEVSRRPERLKVDGIRANYQLAVRNRFTSSRFRPCVQLRRNFQGARSCSRSYSSIRKPSGSCEIMIRRLPFVSMC